MTKRKRIKTAHYPAVSLHKMAATSQGDGLRQRNGYPTPPHAPGVRIVNAASSADKGSSGDFGLPGMIGRHLGYFAAMIAITAPYYVNWVFMTGLIFGGCCSNVFTLEKIVKEEPNSGLLITFTQFLTTALITFSSHFSSSSPPFFLKRRAVPLIRWLPIIIMFFATNLLNNFAFSYNISVPVHIILRSGGSITTMLVGYAWGKRYSPMQVASVVMLTAGVILASTADARSRGKTSSSVLAINAVDSEVVIGFSILFVALLISAGMGLYTELLYARYGSHPIENLFYTHFLSIPLFLPFFPSLYNQFQHFVKSTPIPIKPSLNFIPVLMPRHTATSTKDGQLPPIFSTPRSPTFTLPKHIIALGLNALTQYACIRGVSLLSARTSALGVSLVLNIRKLVSFFVSIWLFGNPLPPGVLVGAAVVFGSGGLYAWATQRIRDKDRDRGGGQKKEL